MSSTIDRIRPPLVSAEERARREGAVSDARVSIELEGFSLSPEAEEDNRAFIAGQITLEEVHARTEARHGRRKT
jgi:hypothetical protein